MDHYWFFTWRTYGTWLPGEDGFVGWYRTWDGRRVTDNQPGRPVTEPNPALVRYARSVMTHEPILLNVSQGVATLEELVRTCRFRGWQPDAVAVIPNHVHIVFGVPGNPDPDRMLIEFKAYCSRVLNRPVKRPSGWWWAENGSTRIVKDHEDRMAAVQYVRDQEGAIAKWLSEEAQTLLGEPGTPVTGCQPHRGEGMIGEPGTPVTG